MDEIQNLGMVQTTFLFDLETRLRQILARALQIKVPTSVEDFERMPEETTRIQAWLGDPGHLELLRTYCQVVQTLRMIQATEIFEEEYVDEDEDEGEEE